MAHTLKLFVFCKFIKRQFVFLLYINKLVVYLEFLVQTIYK